MAPPRATRVARAAPTPRLSPLLQLQLPLARNLLGVLRCQLTCHQGLFLRLRLDLVSWPAVFGRACRCRDAEQTNIAKSRQPGNVRPQDISDSTLHPTNDMMLERYRTAWNT